MRTIIKPTRDEDGIQCGAEAHDEASGQLLATAEQVAMEGENLVIEETQFSGATEIYKGRLYFDPGGYLVKEHKISGEKRWNVFQNWS